MSSDNKVKSYQTDEELATTSEDFSFETTSKESLPTGRSFAVLIFIAVALFAVAGVLNMNDYDVTTFTKLSKTKPFKSTSSYTIYANVSFTDYDQPDSLTSGSLPWDFLAEPYKTQKIYVTALVVDGTVTSFSDASVSWLIDGTTYSGSSIDFSLTSTGIYESSVTLTIDDTEYTRTFTIANKYIRREIRSLTEDDRQLYFTTLNVFYQTSQSDGEALYGSDYRSAESLLYRHLNGAGTSDCDHWHDGAGIITHHSAFTLEAEMSLQSIAPTVAMPYWEYAMDYDTYTDLTWVESPIFDTYWFGAAAPANDDHILTEGPFAGVSLPDGSPYSDWDIASTGTLNPFMNAYGLMRTPWNNNPSPYIGRYNYTYGIAATKGLGRPSCTTMSNCYASSSISVMNECMNGDTHGPVHIMIGGVWGDEDVFDNETTYNKVSFMQNDVKLLLFKMLWRSGYTRCPTTCTADSCNACSVPDSYIETYGARYMLEQSGVYDAISNVIGDFDDSELLTILRAIEDSGVAGEMFTSSAPYDPTFWPLHGSIERLVGLKRINVQLGNIDDFDETWGYDYGANSFYLAGICDWSAVDGADDLTLPTCDMSSTNICPGHNADDVLEWQNITGKGETYTNSEMYDFINPWNDDLPYTYDTFSFDYCYEYYDDAALKF